MDLFIYFLIALLATTAGSITGMGGGVMIKPGLDLLNQFPAESISVLSSLTVFAMSIVSVGKHIQHKTAIPYKIALPLALGSILGGNAGQFGLKMAVSRLPGNQMVLVVQNGILAILIIAVLAYMLKKSHIRSLRLSGILPPLLAGLVLGFFSSFLGIGGGPFNVALLIYMFSLSTRTATICSIIIILFSQLAKIVSISLLEGFAVYDLSLLPPMVIGGVIGGFAGAWINRKMSDTQVDRTFNVVQVAVLLICIYNIIRNLFFMPV